MTYDENGNLWLLNNAGSLIKYIDPNGIYHDVNHSVKASTSQDIIISNQNQNHKIVFIPRTTSNTTSQIFAFDDNGTINSINDDKTVTLTKVYDQDNKEINFCGSANLRSIAQDKKGTLWVGTTEGLFLINDPSKMFENDFKVHRIKIARNDDSGLADYLLGTEEIKTIAAEFILKGITDPTVANLALDCATSFFSHSFSFSLIIKIDVHAVHVYPSKEKKPPLVQM